MLIFDERAERYQTLLRESCPDIAFEAATTHAEAEAVAPTADGLAIIGPLVWPELIDAATKLRWVHTLTSGTSPIVSLPNLAPSVIVTSTRGIHGPNVSEMVFLHMLALVRDYPRMRDNQHRGAWDRWFQGLLFRKTVCIYGLGVIAKELAPRCAAFGMRVTGISDHTSAAPHFERIVTRAQAPAVLAGADFVVILVPRTAENTGFIGNNVVDHMKRSAFLVNVSHGGVVDETALTQALASGRIAGASSDVFAAEPLPADSPLWSQERLMITPHLGGMSDIYVEQAVPIIVDNVRAFDAGRYDDMINVVRPGRPQGVAR